MLTASRLRPPRAITSVATLIVLALVALAAASPATGASSSSCARQVIADWFDNTRIDRIYPLHCYREAVKILPVDVRDYSSAREDILRALAYAQQGKQDPGDSGSQAGGGGSGTGSGPGDGGSGGTGTVTDPGGADGGPGPAEGPVDTSGPSAVPIPLLVLAGIAGLLLVLGAAGYLTRRAAERRADGPGA